MGAIFRWHFKKHFIKWNYRIVIKTSLKFIAMGKKGIRHFPQDNVTGNTQDIIQMFILINSTFKINATFISGHCIYGDDTWKFKNHIVCNNLNIKLKTMVDYCMLSIHWPYIICIFCHVHELIPYKLYRLIPQACSQPGVIDIVFPILCGYTHFHGQS